MDYMRFKNPRSNIASHSSMTWILKNIAIVGNENTKKRNSRILQFPRSKSLKLSSWSSLQAQSLQAYQLSMIILILLLGSSLGSSVQPTDAYQMLGRVRQCKEFHIYADQTLCNGCFGRIAGKTASQCIRRIKSQKSQSFRYLKQNLKRYVKRAVLTFANNLIWILESKKFTVKRVQQFDASSHAETFKYTKDKIKGGS